MSLIERISRSLDIDENLIKTIARTSNKYYRVFSISKKFGGVRSIYHPSPILKVFQYWLVQNLISHLPVSEHATAYGLGCSIKRNAQLHAAAKHIVRMDVKNFFPSIRFQLLADRINAFRDTIPGGASLTEEDLQLINGICFVRGRLVIGSVCAPAISNAVMYPFDCEVSQQARALHLTYSRYADDIVFSSNEWIHPSIVEDIDGRLGKFGMKLNREKTIFMGGSDRKMVTGILLNTGRLSIGRARKESIKKMLYQKLRTGAGDNRKILGYLNYLRDIEPDTFNRMVVKYNSFFGRNIMRVLTEAPADTRKAQAEAAPTKKP
ncbi:MAG: RNA-directed DNA polymerase [Firmicutes bacterium]|nr:RNA-directed DNA polymerase [Bacillota bacterium]